MSNFTLASSRHRIDIFLFWVGFAIASAAAIGPSAIVPKFSKHFSAMGYVALPWFTEFALDYYPALAVLPIAVLAVWWLWPKNSHRGMACAAIGIGGSLLMTYLLVAALRSAR